MINNLGVFCLRYMPRPIDLPQPIENSVSFEAIFVATAMVPSVGQRSLTVGNLLASTALLI